MRQPTELISLTKAIETFCKIKTSFFFFLHKSQWLPRTRQKGFDHYLVEICVYHISGPIIASIISAILHYCTFSWLFFNESDLCTPYVV